MNGASDNSPQRQGQKSKPLMLSEKVRQALRVKHYSLRTEDGYWGWMVRFLEFHREKNGTTETDGTDWLKGWRHPREMGVSEAAG